MSNPYLFGAFALVAIVFFIHNLTMSSKQARLEKKLEQLKSQLSEHKPR
jgi:ABC-type amino acid transport system permease subunit